MATWNLVGLVRSPVAAPAGGHNAYTNKEFHRVRTEWTARKVDVTSILAIAWLWLWLTIRVQANMVNKVGIDYHKGTVTKKFKSSNRFTGLSANQSYHLEVSILERLNAPNLSPATICSNVNLERTARFFPKLLARNDATLTFTTSYDGTSLDQIYEKNRKARDNFCSLPLSFVIQAAECMVTLLERAHVKHMDMDPSGKNMLIHRNRLTLYDFDIAQIDGTSLLPELARMAENRSATSLHHGVLHCPYNCTHILVGIHKKYCPLPNGECARPSCTERVKVRHQAGYGLGLDKYCFAQTPYQRKHAKATRIQPKLACAASGCCLPRMNAGRG